MRCADKPTFVENHVVRIAVVLLERQLGSIVILDLADRMGELCPGVFDTGVWSELEMSAIHNVTADPVS